MKNRRLFWGLFGINFLITLGFGIADAFFSVYVISLGARGFLLGLPLGIYALSKIILSPFMGAGADLVGRRRFLLISISLYLIVSLSYLITSDLTFIVFIRLLQGAGCAMLRPVLISLISECTPEDRRAEGMGKFDISFYGALSLGPVIGGILKDACGFTGIFAMLALLCAVALVIAWVCIPICRPRTVFDAAAAGPADMAPLAGMSGQYRTFTGLLAFIFGRACGISLLGAFLPVLLIERLHLSGTGAGMIIASSTVVMTLLLYPAGKLSDRAPRKWLIFAGGVMVSLLYFLIPSAPGFHQMLLICAGIGFFSVLSQPASSALLVEEGQRHGMGVTLGIFNAVLNLGFVAGPLIGAGIQSSTGLAVVFYAAGGIGLAACLIFFACIMTFSIVDKIQLFFKRKNKLIAANGRYQDAPITDHQRPVGIRETPA